MRVQGADTGFDAALSEEEMVLRYVRLVRACARPYFLAGGDGEDLIQEGMLGLLSAIRSFDEARGVRFETYAELCVRRRIISAVRKAALRFRGDSDIPLEAQLLTESETPGAYLLRDPEELVIARERIRELAGGIEDSLSKLESIVLKLYLDGYSYGEMSEKLGRPYKSVENAIQRIRRKLARFITSGDIQ
ncbi:MAG: sigma-70 family RNA polymerase sigma factor [Oscillospiraceae bacterium]|jgi:RNA polymerase sporulation-specific sigma factor|nr:sigma-70 family RNA polymerase sigma factor [Oscillospiraceae bacterium]